MVSAAEQLAANLNFSALAKAEELTMQQLGRYLEERLEERFGNHRHVGDNRGRGLFRAIELVADRAAKSTFDPALRLHAAVKREALARGLVVYPMGGTIDGKHGDHVVLAPPFIIEQPEIDTVVERLGEAVDAAIAAVGPSARKGEPA